MFDSTIEAMQLLAKMPIGSVDDPHIVSSQLAISPEARLLLYTDGWIQNLITQAFETRRFFA
ncbi:MAG: hypothetical protein LZF86_190552 [Nitrospira sp.]|nr:MAG: hypothetical protein LZF86_190552 [Nitrospira sp.]